MKGLQKLTLISLLIFSSTFASAAAAGTSSYFNFDRVAQTIDNASPVLTSMGNFIPGLFGVIIPIVMIGVVITIITGGALAILGLLAFKKLTKK